MWGKLLLKGIGIQAHPGVDIIEWQAMYCTAMYTTWYGITNKGRVHASIATGEANSED